MTRDDTISREDKKHIDGFKYWCETNEENGTITIPKFVCDEIVKILDKLPSVTPKPKQDVLDKIRAEIHATAEMHCDGCYYLRDEWIDEIFDKYKAESEKV